MLDCIKRLIGAGAAALLLLLVTGHPLASERGEPFISWYPPQVYGAGTQNWAVTQGDDGIMYFGNDGVVLTFDGARWERIKVASGRAIRSLARASDGRILVGSQGDFGFLEPTDGGAIEYVSLADDLPEDAPAFTDIWQVLVDNDRWFFSSHKALFQVESGNIHIHSHEPAQAGGAFLVGGELYIDLDETGLSRLSTNGLESLSADSSVRHVFAMTSLPDGRILIGTLQDGLLAYSPATATVDPVAPRASRYLADKRLYHGISLSDGRVALATLRGGVILVDVLADEFEVIDKRSGLPDIRVWHVFLDADDGLWLGMDSGIARVESNSALSRFNSQRGLEGPVLSLSRHNGKLHAGTTLGLFRLVDGYFESVEGIDSEVWDLAGQAHERGARAAAGCNHVRYLRNTESIHRTHFRTLPEHQSWQAERSARAALGRHLRSRPGISWTGSKMNGHRPSSPLMSGRCVDSWQVKMTPCGWKPGLTASGDSTCTTAGPLWNHPPPTQEQDSDGMDHVGDRRSSTGRLQKRHLAMA
jgi:hypothetical protein